MDGGHSIYIADDVFMLQLEQLQREAQMTEAEAFDTLLDVQWWYEHPPLSGVFIDGVEQTDTAQYSKRAKEREAMNAWLARHVEESEVSNAD